MGIPVDVGSRSTLLTTGFKALRQQLHLLVRLPQTRLAQHLENKIRLLEWKVRLDLTMYASRKSPDMRLDEIREYKPRHPSGWEGIEDRVVNFYDDGHAPKLIRALAHGQKICKPYEGKESFRVKHDDWLQMGHMAIDSVENTRKFSDVSTWVRSAGFEEAWEKVPLRSQL